MSSSPPAATGSRGKKKAILGDSDDEGDDVASPKPAKRARRSSVADGESDGGIPVVHTKNGKLSSSDGNDDEDEDEVDEEEEDSRPQDRVGLRPELERGSDGYISGSVVRLKMRNFMTYTSVEFHPGPYLNMIVGPNGTGKSTISSAIALGLGWSVKMLGRGDELRDFVKMGEEWAETEVELKGRKGKRNVIVWRRFTRDHKSEWKINNESASKKDVTKILKTIGVEEANLCSFLPQEKVADFAKMQPNFLLRQTMLAAGDPRLSDWYGKLCVDGKKLSEVEDQLKAATDSEEINQAAVETIEPDLRNYQARQENEFEVEVLSLLVKAEEPVIIKAKHEAAVSERRKLKDALAVAQARRQPELDLQNEQRAKAQKAAKRYEAADKELKEISKGCKDNIKKLDEAANKLTDAQAQREQLKRKAEQAQARKSQLKEKLERAQENTRKPTADTEASLAAKASERREHTGEFRRAKADLLSREAKLDADMSRMKELQTQLTVLNKRQQDASNAALRRENNARHFDPSISFALDWLADHESDLEKPVGRPAMISVNVIDPGYAWQVEMCTSMPQRKTFVCQTQADYAKMIKLNGTVATRRQRPDGVPIPDFTVRLHLAVQEVTEATARPEPPINRQVLENLGMDGFALDFVDAPAPILAYLCDSARLHQAALTKGDGSQVNQKALLDAGIWKYVTSKEFITAKKSQYGNKQFQISARPPVAARGFTSVVDTEAIKKIDDEIGNLRRELKEFEGPFGEAKQAAAMIRENMKETQNRLSEIDKEEKRLKQILTNAQQAHIVIETTKRQLAELESEPSQDAERARIKKKILDAVRTRLAPLKAYCNLGDKTLEISTKAIGAALANCQYSVNVHEIDRHVKEGGTALSDIKEAAEEAARRTENLKAHYVAVSNKIKAEVAAAPQRVKDEFHARHIDANFDEFKEQLANATAELEGNGEIQYDVVRKYEAAVAKLRASEEDAERFEDERDQVQDRVNTTLASFNPCLDTLVDVVSKNFTAAFERLKCSGEVVIHRAENNFEAWGLNIWVSYRDNDRLALLTANHQSGGERSLATVTYLMSLSEMARTPFALVDEINQGMDQRAEKNVHEMLVETTCSSNAGQYFLITPKLLPGLSYHEKMKLLVINNGMRIPEPTDEKQRYGGFKDLLKKYKRAHAISA